MLKIICVKNFRVNEFLWFRSIREIFLTVNSYYIDEHLENSWRLVYYQVAGEPGIADCSRQYRTFTSGDVDFVHMLTHWSSPRNLYFHVLNFAVGLDCEIILTTKFSRSTVLLVILSKSCHLCSFNRWLEEACQYNKPKKWHTSMACVGSKGTVPPKYWL